MREIRQKPESREPRFLRRMEEIPKAVMREMAAEFKEKAVEEIKSAPFDSRQEGDSNTPADSAGEQLLSAAEDTAKKGEGLALHGGKNCRGLFGKRLCTASNSGRELSGEMTGRLRSSGRIYPFWRASPELSGRISRL